MEADIEIGFCLVDLTESRPADKAQLVVNAEQVYQDVLARLERLEPLDREHFEPLVRELRRSIDLVSRSSSSVD